MKLMSSFSENLEDQFSDFSLSEPKYAQHLHHLYADYIELLALFSNDIITSDNALTRIKSEIDGDSENDSDDDSEIGSSKTDNNDKKESWILNAFSLLSTRADNYEDDDYPFISKTKEITLKEKLSVRQKIYLVLLLCSNLNQFKKMEHTLTSEFEIISYEVLKNYLPSRAEVKQIGKNSNYSGNAIKKIKDLASDMRFTIDEHEIANIPPSNNQERGLDVIGWIPFKDTTSNTIVILGQCACGKDWYEKRYDPERYEKYIKFTTLKPIYSLFIPYALLKDQNNFHQSDQIFKYLIFERARILDYTIDTDYFDDLNSKKLVEKSIEYEEDIV